MSEQNELNAEIAGNKINLKNLPLNWIAIIGILFVSAAGLWMLNEHKAEAKEHGNAIVLAIKEFSFAQRVTNCLMATKQEEREAKLPVCERIAR